jgi:hypothetical protein
VGGVAVALWCGVAAAQRSWFGLESRAGRWMAKQKHHMDVQDLHARTHAWFGLVFALTGNN